MNSWQVCPSTDKNIMNVDAFQNPNLIPLLGTGAIWPRHSISFAHFFAKHYHPLQKKRQQSSSPCSWNEDIGKNIAAKQIANALSMIPKPKKQIQTQISSLENRDCESDSDQDDDDDDDLEEEDYFFERNDENNNNAQQNSDDEGGISSNNNNNPKNNHFDFEENNEDDEDEESDLNKQQEQNQQDLDVLKQIEQSTKATTSEDLRDQMLSERQLSNQQHHFDPRVGNNNSNDDNQDNNQNNNNTRQNHDNHFDSHHHHNTVNPPIQKTAAFLLAQRNACLLRDFGGDGVLDLPHVALVLPSSEIAVIDRDLARVHVFAPNSPHQHRTLLAAGGQLVGPLGGCVTAAEGDLVVCDLVGASVVVVDPLAGVAKVRWLGSRLTAVSETDMMNKTRVYRAEFVMPKDAVEVPLSVLGPELNNNNNSANTSATSSAFSSFFGFGNSNSNPNSTTVSKNNSNNNNNQNNNQNSIESMFRLEPCATIISDYGSGKLVRLNHKTGYSQVIDISGGGGGGGVGEIKPGALCYDAKTKSLLVSDELRNRIYIFRPHDFQKIGIIDLHSLLHTGLRSGPYGMASVFVPWNSSSSSSEIPSSASSVGLLASNPSHKSVLKFHDILGKSQTEPPKWGVSRNGAKIFKFPSGVTLFPYNTFCVVCRNTGYCHFVPVPK